MSLHHRVAALEAASGVGQEWPKVRMLSAINPGFIDSPRVRAEFYGQTLLRHDGEAEDEFQARAVEAAKAAATPGNVAELTLYGAEPPTQWCHEGGVLVARPVAEAEAAA